MSAKLLGAAFDAKMGSHTRKLILLKLVDAAHDDGTKIFPSVDAIAAAAECSEREVQRQLRNMEAAGLIFCVAYENGGRGKAREYVLRTEILRELALVGFGPLLDRAAAAAQGEKGDTKSPFDGAAENGISDQDDASESVEKGDTTSPFNSGERVTSTTERVTPTTERVTPGVTPSLRPLKEPSIERGDNQDTEKEQPDPESDEAFQALLKRYPTVDVPGRCWPHWKALTEEERKRAGDRLDGYRAMQRNQGRTHVHSLQTYLREKLFDQVPADQAEARALVVEPRSHDWWALFWRLIAKPDDDPFKGQDRIVNRRAHFMLSRARENGAATMTVAEAPTHGERAALEKVEVGTLDCAAWLKHINALGYRLSLSDGAALGRFFWVPKGGVPA